MQNNCPRVCSYQQTFLHKQRPKVAEHFYYDVYCKSYHCYWCILTFFNLNQQLDTKLHLLDKKSERLDYFQLYCGCYVKLQEIVKFLYTVCHICVKSIDEADSQQIFEDFNIHSKCRQQVENKSQKSNKPAIQQSIKQLIFQQKKMKIFFEAQKLKLSKDTSIKDDRGALKIEYRVESDQSIDEQFRAPEKCSLNISLQLNSTQVLHQCSKCSFQTLAENGIISIIGNNFMEPSFACFPCVLKEKIASNISQKRQLAINSPKAQILRKMRKRGKSIFILSKQKLEASIPQIITTSPAKQQSILSRKPFKTKRI